MISVVALAIVFAVLALWYINVYLPRHPVLGPKYPLRIRQPMNLVVIILLVVVILLSSGTFDTPRWRSLR